MALSDPGGVLASPFTILERGQEPRDIAAIIGIAAEQGVGLIVVGLPRSMDGSVGPQAAKTQDFTERLRRQTDIPLVYRDERLTTVSARRLMPLRRGRRAREKVRYDAAAAAVILQSYLEEARCQDGT